jgi:eukaryotic-like serine/threonine-protein kinase
MFRINFHRTGASNEIGIQKLLGVKWKVKIDPKKYFGSAPIINDNELYFLNASGYLEVLDKQNGRKLWEVFLEKDTLSQLVLHSTFIYISGEDGYISAIDLQAKCQKWRSKTGISRNLEPVIINDVVCINDQSGCLYGLDRETGQSLWIFQPAKDMEMTPIAAMRGVIYVGSYNGYFYAVNAKTGEMMWQVEVGTLGVDAVPVVFENVVYIVAKKRTIYAVDADYGQIVKEIEIGDEALSQILSIAVVDGVIYIQDSGGYFCAINVRSCQELWRTHNRQYLFINRFIVSSAELYSGSTGAVHALDLKTGKELWKFIAPDFEMWILKPKLWWIQGVNLISKITVGIPLAQMFSCPTVSDRVIYVICTDGYLYALH